MSRTGNKIISLMDKRALVSPIIAQIAALQAENARLRIAFHDAIRRPLGVTPDSGIEFYDARMADEAEARRAASSRPTNG